MIRWFKRDYATSPVNSFARGSSVDSTLTAMMPDKDFEKSLASVDQDLEFRGRL